MLESMWTTSLSLTVSLFSLLKDKRLFCILYRFYSVTLAEVKIKITSAGPNANNSDEFIEQRKRKRIKLSDEYCPIRKNDSLPRRLGSPDLLDYTQ